MQKKLKRRKHPDEINLVVGQFTAPEDDDDLTIEDFQESLLIDKNDLDEEIVRQPDLVFRVGEKTALQISRRDAAKQYVENVTAQADAIIRRGAEHSSKGKLTVQEVEALKVVDARVVRATDQLLRMEHSVRRWKVLEQAVSSRGFALGHLVELYSREYFTRHTITKSESTMKDIGAHSARRAMSELRKTGRSKR